MRRFLSVKVVLLAAIVAAGIGLVGSPTTTQADTWVIFPDDSIQSAVDSASPGDTIILSEGTYYESVVVDVDGITIKGANENVVIRPPLTCADVVGACSVEAADSPCEVEVGFCIVEVEGVKLKRITVTGFDAGVVVLDSEDVRVEDIRALDNEMVGIAVLAAGGITLHRNTAGSSSEAAFPPLAGILVLSAGEIELRLNRTDRNFLGIGAALVYGAWVTSNTARDNCAGIAALWSFGWALEYNTVHDNRSACNVSLDGLFELATILTGLSPEAMAASAESRGFVEGATATLAAVESVGTADDAIEFSGVGILLATVSGMDIVGNSAIGNRSNLFTTGTETVPSGGIVLVEVAGENSNLFFKGNFLRRNDVDINFDSGLPDDSKATQNRCKSNPQTSPSGYCNFNTLP